MTERQVIDMQRVFAAYGFAECSTGGGCTALRRVLPDGLSEVLITDAEDACVPGPDTREFAIGLRYHGDGTREDPSFEDVHSYTSLKDALYYLNVLTGNMFSPSSLIESATVHISELPYAARFKVDPAILESDEPIFYLSQGEDNAAMTFGDLAHNLCDSLGGMDSAELTDATHGWSSLQGFLTEIGFAVDMNGFWTGWLEQSRVVVISRAALERINAVEPITIPEPRNPNEV